MSEENTEKPSFLLRALKYVALRVVNIVIFFAVIYGGAYLYLQFNPEHKARVMTIWKQIETTLDMVEQQDTTSSTLEQLQSLLAMTGKTTSVSSASDEAEGSFSALEASESLDVPANVLPLLLTLRGTRNYEEYAARLSKKHIGENGHGAVPILKKALESPNPKLQDAALAGLLITDTPEAQELATQWKEKIIP